MEGLNTFRSTPGFSEDLEGELDNLEGALSETPGDAALLLKKAQILFKLAYYNECLSICRSISDGESKKWIFILLETACDNWIYKREKMLSWLNEFTPIPKTELFNDLGTILGVFCDLGDAIYYLTNLLKKEQNERVWYLLARLQRADGKLKEALGCIEKALGIVRDFEPAIKLKEKIRVEILRGATRAAKTGGYLESVPVQEARAGFSAEDWFVRGLGNVRQNNHNAALKSFAEALKCEPQFHVCWYYAGRAQEKLGGEPKARQCYKKFIDGFPRASGFYRERLFKTSPEADRRFIEGLYHRWIGFLPEDQRAWIAYLKYLVDNNDTEAVRLVISEILARYINHWFIDTSSPQFSLIRGLLEIYVGRTRSARNSFDVALKSKNLESIALLGIGKSYEYIGHLKDAEDYYRKVTQIKGAGILGLYQLAHVNLLKNSGKEAFARIDEALNVRNDSILLKGKRAEILLEFSDLKGFMEYFTSIVNKEYLHIHLDLMKGLALYKAQRYDEAIWEFEAAKARNPGNTLILKNLGVLYLYTERYNKVRDVLEDLRKIKDFDAEMFLLQGLSYYFAGEYTQSLEFMESYMNLCPFDPRVWSISALIWYGMGNYDISETSFINAKDLANGVGYTWLNLAIFYCNMGDYEKAARCLEMITGQERECIQYHMCMARCLRAQGNSIQAQASITEVLNREPQNISALTLSCLIQFDAKDYEKSIEHLSKAMGLDESRVEFLYIKGVILTHKGDSNNALEAINQALHVKPDYYEAWLSKAVLYWSVSDLKEAGEALKGAQNLRPKEFGEWLRFASSQKDHLSAISLDVKIEIPFYVSTSFPIAIEDPVNIFKYDKLDNIFS